jgi:hypothetical protein
LVPGPTRWWQAHHRQKGYLAASAGPEGQRRQGCALVRAVPAMLPEVRVAEAAWLDAEVLLRQAW